MSLSCFTLFSGVIALNFAVNLTEGGTQCSTISTAYSTGQYPQIAISFIQYSEYFSVSNLAVLFTTARSNLQFGGLDDNCPGYTRLGHWPSEFKNVSGNRTACTVLDAPLDLPPGFTQVCILLATNDSSCGRSSKKRNYYHYYAGQLVISGFSTS